MTFWDFAGVFIGLFCGWLMIQMIGAPDPKPFDRTCPARNGEQLAYSTYHSDGRLECTYIRNTTGAAKRTI